MSGTLTSCPTPTTHSSTATAKAELVPRIAAFFGDERAAEILAHEVPVRRAIAPIVTARCRDHAGQQRSFEMSVKDEAAAREDGHRLR